jgi:hypothetical protein
MPQASDELRAIFSGDDQKAFAVIKANFTISRGGVIYPKQIGYQMTEREREAVNYLCDEWDYDYSPIGEVCWPT